MSTSVNVTNPKIDTTVRVFDNFYKYDEVVPVNEFDAAFSYFNSVFASESAARNFTTSLFQIAADSGIPAMTLLDEFRRLDQFELTVTLAYYLNNIRSPSTLLGVNSVIVPNYFAARNVLA
jgi:hypothetical protein